MSDTRRRIAITLRRLATRIDTADPNTGYFITTYGNTFNGTTTTNIVPFATMPPAKPRRRRRLTFR